MLIISKLPKFVYVLLHCACSFAFSQKCTALSRS